MTQTEVSASGPSGPLVHHATIDFLDDHPFYKKIFDNRTDFR